MSKNIGRGLKNPVVTTSDDELTFGEFIDHVAKNKIDLGVTFSVTNKGFVVNVKKPLVLNLMDELELTIDGETNIVSKGMNLDTLFDHFGTVLHLNGREAKQIKDHPKSIAFRKEKKEKIKELEELARNISHPSLPTNASLEQKIKFIQSKYTLKDITGKDPFPDIKE